MSERPVEAMTRSEAVEHFADRCQRIANEIAQGFRDAAKWNEVHGHDEQLDPDPDGALRDMYDQCVAFIAREAPGRRMIMPLYDMGNDR